MQQATSDIRDRVPEFGERIQVDGDGVEPRLNAEEGIYNGTPNGQDLARIRKRIGGAAEADDWVVYSFLAFDNSINLDFEIFSPSMVAQYSDRIAGKSFLLNHDQRNVGSSKGLILEAKVYRLDSIPEYLREDLPNFTGSQRIAEEAGGYYWCFAKAAMKANHPVAEGLADGSINRCSIGALTYDETLYCPDCSARLDRYVDFWEKEEVLENSEDGTVAKSEEYICPHVPLSFFFLMLYSCFGDPDNPPLWSTGIGRDGALYPAELSICVHGALGSAKVIRN